MNKGLFKIISIFLVLFIASMALYSCGDEQQPCTEHKDDNLDSVCDICETTLEPQPPSCEHRDEDADYACDKCGADFFPECYDHINENNNSYCDICGELLPTNVNFKICDQEGIVLSGVKVIITNIDGDEYEAESGANGEFTLSLLPGSYRVTYDESTVPEGYIAFATNVVVDENGSDVTLEVLNNIPDGTIERPYVINSDLETNSVSLIGGEKSFYIVPHGGSRIITFLGADFEIVYYERLEGEDTYNKKTYTPDDDGKITFRFTETDIKTPSLFTVENKSLLENEVVIELKSEPGTLAKPYEITDISSPILSSGEAGKTIYYKLIASENGELKFYSSKYVYSISVGSTESVLLAKSDGSEGAFGVYYANTPEGAIELEILDGLIVVRESEIGSIEVGTEYKYEINANGRFVIKDSTTEEEIQPFMISPVGRVITITNNRNSNQKRIDELDDEEHILVEEGDEIVIAIYAPFDMEIEIKIEY